MSSGGNSWLGGKGGARSKAKTTREWRKKKRKREFFRTLENKEKGFFFFFLGPQARRYLLAQLNTLFLLSRKASLEEFVGIGNGRFFSSVE